MNNDVVNAASGSSCRYLAATNKRAWCTTMFHKVCNIRGALGQRQNTLLRNLVIERLLATICKQASNYASECETTHVSAMHVLQLMVLQSISNGLRHVWNARPIKKVMRHGLITNVCI